MIKKTCIILVLMPLFISIIVFPILPESVPMHFDMYGVDDRWGNKSELILIPTLVAIFSSLIYFGAKTDNPKYNTKENLYYTAPLVLGMFGMNHLVFLYQVYYISTEINAPIAIEVNQSTFFLTGLFMIGMGIISPKLKKNNWVGFRTKQSLKNNNNWILNQRIGGNVLILFGVIISIGNLFFKGYNSFIFTMSCLIILLPVLIIARFILRKKH